MENKIENQMDYFKDFNIDKSITWLNCAHQGPMPKVSTQKAIEAIKMKESPNKISDDLFFSVPKNLKTALGKLVNVLPDDIILGNSATFTVHLLANGIKWKKGDEVLLVKGDFPTNYYSWLDLQKKGVNVKFIECKNDFFTPEDLLKNLSPKSKLLCVSYVNSFNGFSIDVEKIGKLCSENNVLFALNGSQSLGWRSINLKSLNIDVFFSCGFKGLLGPYGTGFCWMKPELTSSLDYNHSYWLSMMSDNLENLSSNFQRQVNIGARKFDVFGTANFLNFMPWTTSIRYLLDCGLKEIENHNELLVSHFLENLNNSMYKVLSPLSINSGSPLIVISHRNKSLNKNIYNDLMNNKIHVSFRKGNLRISPHLYNTISELDKLLNILINFHGSNI